MVNRRCSPIQDEYIERFFTEDKALKEGASAPGNGFMLKSPLQLEATTDWKKGFYYIALKANIPILLYGLDYGTKRIVCTKSIVPNGDIDAQMAEIKAYFKDFKGKHPQQFAM